MSPSLHLALTALLAAAPAAAVAQASDPAATQIQGLNDALIAAMKQGKAAGVQGRMRTLTPAVERALDLPTMTRLAVGPAWSGFSPADQAAVTRAFSRMSVASYAKNFDSYGGEQIKVDKVESRGPDKLVHTSIASPGAKPELLVYRMRQAADGSWKVIDVFYRGSISELATRRSDFASAVKAGAPALVKRIDALTAKLMAG